MPAFFRSRLALVPSLPFILISIHMLLLVVAGGSARADVTGQIIVRASATCFIILALLLGSRPRFAESSPLWIILFACIALPVVQLIPLPPTLWEGLPGRALLSQAAIVVGEPQPWRPISMVPGATINAVNSLIVPLATMLLLAQLSSDEHRRMPTMVLSIIAVQSVIGLAQFTGLGIVFPFGDNGPPDVNGTFTNRNHFALLLAIGCVLAPAWAFMSSRQERWRRPLALGLFVLFVLLILASGSRAGLVLGGLSSILGMVIAWHGISRALARYPKWIARAAVGTVLTTVVALGLISTSANRAISINRLLTTDAKQDLRGRALPTVMTMAKTYFPAGAGYGSFDPVFRIHEPFALLSPEYFNHAHNDFLEVVQDGGAAGALLLAGALLWWTLTTIGVWKNGSVAGKALSRTGSAIVLLILVASLTDYPARTPLVMAILTVAAFWMTRPNTTNSAPLPPTGRLL